MFNIKTNLYKKDELIKLNNVEGKVKKFNKKLYDKYDNKAREIIKNLLGNSIKDNENIYAEDMIFTIKNFPYKYLEIQVLGKWENIFPYNYPFVYARKMKFSKDTLFVTFNKHLTEIILFARNGISNIASKLKKYDRETVYYISWNNVIKLPTYKLSIKLIKEFSGDIDDM